MDARFYNSEEIDVERLANDLENVYRSQGYQVQQFGNRDQTLVQLKKGSDFEAIIGMQTALSVTIQRTSGGVMALMGHQRWLDKAAVGAVGIVAMPVLWPLAITAGVGAVRQASLANQVLNVVDGLVRQQQPGVRIGPIPVSIMPQAQQQWAPPPPSSRSYVPPYVPPAPAPPAPQPTYTPMQQASPAAAPAVLRCPNCNTPYEQGDTFCTGCGRSLVLRCPNCHSELKPDASFCPQCGASTFQTQAQPAQPPPTPTYTPPAQAAQPKYVPPVAPTMPAAPARPAPEPYVPSVPQQPPVIPKPTVTFIPASTPTQAGTPDAPTVQQQAASPLEAPTLRPTSVPPPRAQNPPPPQPIRARPASEAAYNPSAPWGTLIFSDGQETQLSGERAVVGRYDHDVGGMKPEVDLGNAQGSDTVSRVHAVIEHVGSAYTVTDLNSTNSTRVNGKRLEPDKATPISDGDSLHFGKVSSTFKKL
ncbi:MAG: FHA domain-containing protein [Ktedonobacteraceae bacterium]